MAPGLSSSQVDREMLVRPDGIQFSLLRVTEEALHTWTATQIRAGLKVSFRLQIMIFSLPEKNDL